MPSIVAILRDAILDGLIPGVKAGEFKKNIKRLKGAELEDYLQELWDDFPPEGSHLPHYLSPNYNSLQNKGN